MLNREEVLNLELAQDVILVKKNLETKKASGLILDEKTTRTEGFQNFDYEIVKIHPMCFNKGDFTNNIPKIGDTVIVNKFDARLIFEDKEEILIDNAYFKTCYYLLKDTNVQAFIKKGE